MPTYDYACSACGHRFEEFQSISSDPLKTCPKCKKKKLERLIGAGAGIIFKGSGFYETDYRSSSYQSDAKKDSETSSGDAASGGASSDSSKGSDKASSPAPDSSSNKND
ncbi:MAG: FmdB family zinc ribbon protein [Planctomycetota bacterium]